MSATEQATERPSERPAYAVTELLHCPYCHQAIAMQRRAPEGMYGGLCKCGVRLGAAVTVYGEPRGGAD